MLHKMLQAVSDANPDAPAIEAGDVCMSYSVVDQKANQLANYLRSQGVLQGSHVAVFLHQSPNLLITMQACFKLGAVYIPLSPDEPAAKRDPILSECAPHIIISTATDCPIRADHPNLLCLDIKQADIDSSAITPLETTSDDEDRIAAIFYSSGTTGRPKGIPTKESGFMYWLKVLRQKIGPRDTPTKVMRYISPSFDALVWESLLAWSQVGCSVIPPRDIRKKLPDLAAFIEASGVTDVLFLPPVLRALLPELSKLKAAKGGAPLALRDIYSTGQELTADDVQQALDLGVDITNGYGPTEIVIGLSIEKCTLANLWQGRAPIAEPEGDEVQAVLVDLPSADGAPQMQELHIITPYATPGYLNRLEETQARFVTIRHQGKSVKAFATGDQFKRGPNGKLYYIGRIGPEAHLKMNGRLVRVQEVECQLREHPAILDACVVPFEVAPGTTILHAFITLKAPDTVPEVSTLKTDLTAAGIIAEAVPANFQMLSAIPTTGNGKTDRKALVEKAKSYYQQLAPSELQYKKASLPEMEKAVAQIWSDVLPAFLLQAMIGDLTPFHHLGGSSLELAQMFLKVSGVFGVNCTLSDFADQNDITIQRVAMLVYKKQCTEHSNFICLYEGDASLAPFFLIHAITGDASTTYMTLAKELSQHFERPIYAIDARAKTNPLHLCVDLSAIANDYVRGILDIQSEGPYHVLGWSSGATFAYQASLALEEKGKEVAFLGLLDGMPPHIYQSVSNNTFLDEIALLVNKLGVTLPEEALKPEGGVDVAHSNKPALINWIFQVAAAQFSGKTPQHLYIAQAFLIGLMNLTDTGATKATPHIFSTQETLHQFRRLKPEAERDLGWLRETQPVTIHEPLGFAHADIISTNAAEFAQNMHHLFRKETAHSNRKVILSPKKSPVKAFPLYLSEAVKGLLGTIAPGDRTAFLEAVLGSMDASGSPGSKVLDLPPALHI